MKIKIFSILVVLLLIAANLPPQLPSSFYGWTTGISAGQTITAKIVGSASPPSSTRAFLWQGSVVYAMDVAGMTSDEGKTVTFKVGGVIVGYGIWHSGTNVRLDLAYPRRKGK
jgi:hypothetical protein